jgi:hypothetical protein
MMRNHILKTALALAMALASGLLTNGCGDDE